MSCNAHSYWPADTGRPLEIWVDSLSKAARSKCVRLIVDWHWQLGWSGWSERGGPCVHKFSLAASTLGLSAYVGSLRSRPMCYWAVHKAEVSCNAHSYCTQCILWIVYRPPLLGDHLKVWVYRFSMVFKCVLPIVHWHWHSPIKGDSIVSQLTDC